METEIIQTVLSELLDELKEVKVQQVELVKGLSSVRDQVTTIDRRISNMKDSEPITAKKLSEINICNYTPQIKD